jgi:hypothetical protein
MSEKRAVIWSYGDDPALIADLEAFRAFAEQAAELGATHVGINKLLPARWQMSDPRDPHPEWASWPIWSFIQPTLFKVAVPPALEEWLPRGEAERNLELIRERCAILRALGLRASWSGNDPMWLPEGAYRAHPEWRGAQAELLCIARLPYFSPCVDHPEVLAMFRTAMAELCRNAPELDFWTAFTNDSGGGICWSGSYPGNNGPNWCRHRTHTERVIGFLTAIQEGAREAGGEVQVSLDVQGSAPLLDLTQLRPGQYYKGRDAQGRPWGSGMGSNGWFGNHLYPVVGVPRILSFAEECEHAFAANTDKVGVSFGPQVQEPLVAVYRALRETPSTGPASRLAVLRDLAASQVGEENAEALLQLWGTIERAVECGRHVRGYGFNSIMFAGPAMMRWLTMPLVPDQSRLSPEQKAGYQRWRVVKDAVEADSYHAILGKRGVLGPAAVWMATNSLNEAISQATSAARQTEALAGKLAEGPVRSWLTALVYRLKALACGYTTCRNFIQYEEALAQMAPEDQEVVWRDHTGTYVINRGGVELRTIARSEVDNAYELARLVEEAPEPVLAMVSDPAEEDSFVFGPHVVAELRRKAEIMLDRWEDYNELYPNPPVIRPTQDPDRCDLRPGEVG